MSLVISTVVVVLSMLVVGICLACDKLPKLEFRSIEILVDNSPFRKDFVLTPLFECCIEVFISPTRGSTNYTGTTLSVNRNKVFTFDFTVGSDKKTIEATSCSTGEKTKWHLGAAQIDKNGAFFCIYTCSNTTTLGEFVCASNNGGASPAELQAVDLARNVSNGNLIHDAWENCPESNGCNAL